MPFKNPIRKKEYNVEYRKKNHKAIVRQKKEFRDSNRELVASQKKESYKRNREHILLQKKEYAERNSERISKYMKQFSSRPDVIKNRNDNFREKYKNDVIFKLSHVLRNRLRYAIKYNKKVGSAVEDLGCSIQDFKFYLEGKFKDGMSWDNYGKWEIDHVIPLIFFDLTQREQFLRACNYTNLQPLWKLENLKKGKKLAHTHYPNL